MEVPCELMEFPGIHEGWGCIMHGMLSKSPQQFASLSTVRNFIMGSLDPPSRNKDRVNVKLKQTSHN